MSRDEGPYRIEDGRDDYRIRGPEDRALEELGGLVDGMKEIFDTLKIDMSKKENLLLFHLLLEFFAGRQKR